MDQSEKIANLKLVGFSSLPDSAVDHQYHLYQFIHHRLQQQTKQLTKPQQNLSPRMHFQRFLTSQFTKFPIANGFPLIARHCQSPKCYFFVDPNHLDQVYHNLINLLVQKAGFSCHNCKGLINSAESLVYDVGLESFLLSNLSDLELSDLKWVEITPFHHIVKPTQGFFHDSFNAARITALEQHIPQLHKAEKSTVLQVQSLSILQKLQQLINQNQILCGRVERERVEEAKKQCLLPICSIRPPSGSITIYKQLSGGEEGSRNAFAQRCSVQLIDPLAAKKEMSLQEYFDIRTNTLWALGSQGTLYYCDFTNMYDMANSHYNLRKYCKLKWSHIKFDRKCTKIVVTEKKLIYLITPAEDNLQFLAVLKAQIPNQANEDMSVQMKEALKDREMRFRSRYGLCLVPANDLIPYQCIVFYGGSIDHTRDFKLLELIALMGNQNILDEYYFHIMRPKSSQINKSLCYPSPTVAVFKRHLILIGRSDVKDKSRTSLSVLPLEPSQESIDVLHQQLGEKDGREEMQPGGGVCRFDGENLVIYGAVRKSQEVSAIRLRLNEQSLQVELVKVRDLKKSE